MVFQTNVYIFFIVWLKKINKELIFVRNPFYPVTNIQAVDLRIFLFLS